MRHTVPRAVDISRKQWFLVGVATEPVTSYGRSILMGVVEYASLQHGWILHRDMWNVMNSEQWPDCDGTVLGGVTAEKFATVAKRSRHRISCSGNVDPSDTPVVCLDDDATGAMAAQHLLERGLKHFALYGGDLSMPYSQSERPRYTFVRRARGFEQALRRAGFSCARTEIAPNYDDFLTRAHHADVVAWLNTLPKPLGVMAVDDSHARDLAEACRTADISIPDHVAIIGVNNDELLCEGGWPQLSSVECNFTRMGYLAAKTLHRMMSGEKLKPEERLVELPPIRVQERMSTDVLAVDQPDVAEAVKFIRKHACDPCTVADVLRAVPVARRTLERLFLDRLGRTPGDEIDRVRAEIAKRLLIHPDLSIDEIGERCGFSTLSSFNRFFRRVVSRTPAAFRRQSLRSDGV